MTILIIVILSFSMFGCKKDVDDTEIDTDNPIVEDDGEEQPPEQLEEDSQQEDIKEPEQPETPIQDNDDKDTPDEYTGISEEDAVVLVAEKIDTQTYKIKYDGGMKEVDGQKYYIYTISDSNGSLEQKIAVENQSGELYCFSTDETIQPYSEFKLYNEAKDAECDWNGIFLRKDKNGKNNATLELAQGDINSFEFSITEGTKKGNGIEFGIGQIMGNTAVFEDEKGFKLEFVMKDNTVTLKESGKNSYSGNGKFDGKYTLKK